VAGGEVGVIFQDGAMRRMTYAPGSPTIFVIERIAEDKGLFAPYSLIRSGDRIFFLASQGFNGMFPNGRPETIGKERVDRTFLAELDTGNLHLVLGASDPRSSRVFWAYPTTSGDAGLFDKIICYDWALNRWSRINTTGEYLASLSQPGTTLEGLDSISGSLDALGFSLDEVAGSVTPEIAAFDSSHILGFFRGDNMEATIDTPEQGASHQRFRVNGLRIVTDAATVYGSVSARESPSGSETWSTEAAADARGYSPQRVSTRYSRGRVRVPSATSWTFASGIEPDVIPEGLR
jgi:hypothetical protein